MFSARTPLIYARFSKALKTLCGILAVILAIVIAQQSLTVSNAQGSIPHLDKLVHLIAYGALGTFAMPALPRIRPIAIFIGLGLFGVIIEFLQGVMGLGRTADILDAASNLTGLALAVAFWMVITKLARPKSVSSQ